MNKTSTHRLSSTLILCFKTPLWHFIKSLVSETPAFKRISRTSGLEGKMMKFLEIRWLTATTCPRVASKSKYWCLAQDVATQLNVILLTKVNYAVKFNLEQDMKPQRRGTGIFYSIYHIDGGRDELSTPRSGRFTLGKGTGYLFQRRLLGRHGQSGRVRKKTRPYQDSIPGLSSQQYVVLPIELPRPITR